jgi:predicted RNA-binding protein with TRAM domain
MESRTPLCLFTGRVETDDGRVVVTVPERELELGTLEAGATYQVGLYPDPSASTEATDGDHAEPSGRDATPAAATEPRAPSPATDEQSDQPPVTEGETRRLDIEDLGEQGDGIARVGPGYVVFVPDTEVGQRPLVRITTVRENFAFAEVVEG